MEKQKIKVQEDHHQLLIEIESRKYWLRILPMSLLFIIWLLAQYFLITTAIDIFLHADNNFPSLILTFLIIGWAFGAFYIVRTLVWQFLGKEVLVFTKNDFSITKQYGILLFDKEVSLNGDTIFLLDTTYSPEIPLLNRRKGSDLLLGKGGRLVVRSSGKVFNFAHGLELQVGEALLEKIQQWYK